MHILCMLRFRHSIFSLQQLILVPTWRSVLLGRRRRRRRSCPSRIVKEQCTTKQPHTQLLENSCLTAVSVSCPKWYMIPISHNLRLTKTFLVVLSVCLQTCDCSNPVKQGTARYWVSPVMWANRSHRNGVSTTSYKSQSTDRNNNEACVDLMSSLKQALIHGRNTPQEISQDWKNNQTMCATPGGANDWLTSCITVCEAATNAAWVPLQSLLHPVATPAPENGLSWAIFIYLASETAGTAD